MALETGNDFFRTKKEVMEFLRQNGFKIVERVEEGLPPYVMDQVWAYNESLMEDAHRHRPSKNGI